MSEEKVTSYELSKQLEEAGFDSERHTGWWLTEGDGTRTYIPFNDISDFAQLNSPIKAYDCFDLLEWLSRNLINEDGSLSLHYDLSEPPSFYCEDAYYNHEFDGVVGLPQEALGKAVLKVIRSTNEEGEVQGE